MQNMIIRESFRSSSSGSAHAELFTTDYQYDEEYRSIDLSNESDLAYIDELLQSDWMNSDIATGKLGRIVTEELFGWFFICCGFAACLANALILLTAVRYLRSRNVLFLIITNFALIDLFKALSAIYMGCVLVSIIHEDTATYSQRYFLTFKMLQTSVFMLNVGNISYMFNLVIATLNEFLYMRLPFAYRKIIRCRRVAVLICLTWLLSVGFSVAKSFHSRTSAQAKGLGIYIADGRNMSLSDDDPIESNATLTAEAGRKNQEQSGRIVSMNHTTSQTFAKHYQLNKQTLLLNATADSGFDNSTDYDGYEEDRHNVHLVYRNNQREETAAQDIYTLIVLSCLMICLVVCLGTYTALYLIIRKSVKFQKQEQQRRASRLQDGRGGSISHHSSFNDDDRRPPVTSQTSAPLQNTSYNHHHDHEEYSLAISGMDDDVSTSNTARPAGRKANSEQTTIEPLIRRIRRRPTPARNGSAAGAERESRISQPLVQRLSAPTPSTMAPALQPSTCPVVPPLLDSNASPVREFRMSSGESSRSLGATSSLLGGGSQRHTPPHRVTLFRQHKSIVVILSVCTLYAIYLAVYFTLQVLHWRNVNHGVHQRHLQQQYTINFALRGLYVLHAALNPLIFFRIRSFRNSFAKLVHGVLGFCCPTLASLQRESSTSTTRTTQPAFGGELDSLRSARQQREERGLQRIATAPTTAAAAKQPRRKRSFPPLRKGLSSSKQNQHGHVANGNVNTKDSCTSAALEFSYNVEVCL